MLTPLCDTPIFCTFHIVVGFLIVPYKGLYGWEGSDYVKLLNILATPGGGGEGRASKSEYIELLYILA